MEKNHTVYRGRRTPCRHRCGAPVCGQRHPFRPLFRLTGSDPHCAGRRPVRLGLEALLSGTAQLPDIRLRIPDRVICGWTEESLLSGALYRAAAMTEGLAQRMEQELGCPCTLVFTGGLGRFVAPLCRREAVCDEDLLLRGLWKRCTANCPSADKP